MSANSQRRAVVHRPLATYLLAAAQLAVWVVVRRYLIEGNAWTDFALRPGTPSEVALLVSPFVHLDPAHLGINLTVLWLFGTNLERAVGSFRFLVLYLGAAWFASLMQWAVFTSFHLNPNMAAHDAAVGSSGAVAGILGASLVRFPQARLRLPLFPRATFSTAPILVLWLVYTVFRALVTTVSGRDEGIGHWAHFAGFIFGLAVAQLFGMHRTAREEYLEQAGRDAAARDDLSAAALAWSALLAMCPHDLRARTGLINACLALADDRGARRLARDGIRNLVRAGDRESAVSAYDQYLDLIPDLELDPGIRFRIGCWLAESGREGAAFTAFWESVREDGPAAAPATLYRAGTLALDRLRDPRRARAAWELLLSRFPESQWSDVARDRLRQLPAQ